jgi:hypothetical protein
LSRFSKKKSDPYKPGVAESKYGNKVAPSSTISEREVFKFKKKTILVVKYISANTETTRKVYSGPMAYPGIFFSGRVSTNPVEDRRQRERGSGDCSPLVRGSAQFANG